LKINKLNIKGVQTLLFRNPPKQSEKTLTTEHEMLNLKPKNDVKCSITAKN